MSHGSNIILSLLNLISALLKVENRADAVQKTRKGVALKNEVHSVRSAKDTQDSDSLPFLKHETSSCSLLHQTDYSYTYTIIFAP